MPPAPGMIASLVSGRPRTHPSDPTLEAAREGEVDRVRRLRGGRSGGEGTAHLRSQERASSKPPPRATPPTAAMVGTGSLCSARKDARRRFTKATTSSSPIARRSFRSAPFEKKTGRVKRFQCHVSSPVVFRLLPRHSNPIRASTYLRKRHSRYTSAQQHILLCGLLSTHSPLQRSVPGLLTYYAPARFCFAFCLVLFSPRRGHDPPTAWPLDHTPNRTY